MSVVANPWRPYGLKADPFFQEPLTPDADAVHPIGLFVGRAEELRLLGSQVLGATSSRAIVQGPIGVGKTSFVNRLKATLAEHGVLTHAQPVRVTGDMTVHGFAAEVLRVLTQIRASQPGPTPAPDDEEAPFWRRVGRQLEGEDVMGGGVSVAGVGVSATRGRIAAERRDLALYPDIERAVSYLAAPRGEGTRGRAASSKHERGRVLLHVNNLENLTRADVEHAAALVQDLRDYFLIPQAHWIFVGADDVEQQVFRASDAVGGIVPLVTDLGPLAPEEIPTLLDRRYAQLRAGVRLVAPVAPPDAVALYRRYEGDLRNYLRLLSNAVQRTPVVGAPAPLTVAAVVQTMAEPYRRALVRQFGAVDAGHLAAIVAGTAAGVRFRVADVATRTGLKQPSATELVERLRARGVIRHDGTEGRSTYYRLRADAEVAFGLA